MSVPYETAVATIESVLGNSMEREIICAVLEANNGHMERTIETLLSMSGEIPVEDAEQNVINQNQVREDALYAKMIQDQLFVNQLRMAPELSELFGLSTNGLRASNPGLKKVLNFLIRCQDNKDDLQIIGEKIKGLGEVAKLKFKELALKFKKPDAKPNLQYTAINNDDDTAVITDSSLAKRMAVVANDADEEDEEVPLTSKKSTSTNNLQSPSSPMSRKGHHKDD